MKYGCRWQLILIFINEQAYNTPAVDDKQLHMLLSNKVTGSVRGQYRHEVQPTEMERDFVESKGSTNLGYRNAFSRFWIRSSVDFELLHPKFHILGRKAQPVGITFSCLDKMYHLMDHFVEFFRMPQEMYSLVWMLLRPFLTQTFRRIMEAASWYHVAGHLTSF